MGVRAVIRALPWAFGALTCVLAACSDNPPESEPVTYERASRIVSLAPHLTEMVFAAGAGERLVGVDAFSDYPAEARALPRVGDAFRVDLEILVRLAPDLILAWASSAPPELIERMNQLKLRVEVMEVENIEDVAQQIRRIGDLAGTRDTAEKTARQFLEGFAELESDGDQNSSSVFYQISANPWFTVTNRHVVGQILQRCGARNIFADLPEPAPGVGLEAIIAAQPEIIIAARAPAESDDWRGVWEDWPEVPAVRRGHLFSVNADLVSRPGPRLLAGARELCRILTRASATGNRQGSAVPLFQPAASP